MYIDNVIKGIEELKGLIDVLEQDDLKKQMVLSRIDELHDNIIKDKGNIKKLYEHISQLSKIAYQYDKEQGKYFDVIRESVKPKDEIKFIQVMPTFSSIVKDIIAENFDRFEETNSNDIDVVLNEMMKHRDNIASLFPYIVSVFESELNNRLSPVHYNIIQFVRLFISENIDRYNEKHLQKLLSITDELLKLPVDKVHEDFVVVVKNYIDTSDNSDDVVLLPVIESIKSIIEKHIIKDEYNTVKSITEKAIAKYEYNIHETTKVILSRLERYTTHPKILSYYNGIEQSLYESNYGKLLHLLESFINKIDEINDIDTRWINNTKTLAIQSYDKIKGLFNTINKLSIVNKIVESIQDSEINDYYLVKSLYNIIKGDGIISESSSSTDKGIIKLYNYIRDKYPHLYDTIKESIISLMDDYDHVHVGDVDKFESVIHYTVPAPFLVFNTSKSDIYVPINMINTGLGYDKSVVAICLKDSRYFEYLVNVFNEDSFKKIQNISKQDLIVIDMIRIIFQNFTHFKFVDITDGKVYFDVVTYGSDGPVTFATLEYDMNTHKHELKVVDEQIANDSIVLSVYNIIKEHLVCDGTARMMVKESDIGYTIHAYELCFDNASLVITNSLIIAGERDNPDECVLCFDTSDNNEEITDVTIKEHIDYIKQVKESYRQLEGKLKSKVERGIFNNEILTVFEQFKSIIDQYEDVLNQIILEYKTSKGYDVDMDIVSDTHFVLYNNNLYRIVKFLPNSKIVVTEQFDILDMIASSDEDLSDDTDNIKIIDNTKIIDLSDILFVKDEELTKFIDKLNESQKKYIRERFMMDNDMNDNMNDDNMINRIGMTDNVDSESHMGDIMDMADMMGVTNIMDDSDKGDKLEDFIVIDDEAYMLVELTNKIEGFNQYVYAKVSDFTSASEDDLVTIYNLNKTKPGEVPKKWLRAFIEIQPEQ